jgi:hypothetical protein
MLKKFVLIGLLINSICCFAQKPTYRSYSYMGVLAGERTGYQLTTIHGLEKKSFFVGLGTGIDNYRLFSIPVFLTASKYLFPSSNNLLFSINTGVSFSHSNKVELLRNATDQTFLPRPFGEAGFSYRFADNSFKNGQGVLIGAYYSYKGMKVKQTMAGFCTNPPCADTYEYLNYELHRWALKLGIAL